MGAAIVGYVLIAIGIVALAAGVGGGIAKMLQDLKQKVTDNPSLGIPAIPTELLKSLADFLKALGEAPVWLALTVIGLALVGYGGSMV